MRPWGAWPRARIIAIGRNKPCHRSAAARREKKGNINIPLARSCAAEAPDAGHLARARPFELGKPPLIKVGPRRQYVDWTVGLERGRPMRMFSDGTRG